MKRVRASLVVALGLAVGVWALAAHVAADDADKYGKLIDRTTLAGESGEEAILVMHELPPGAESGKHTQMETEIVYVTEGAVTLEVQGKAPVTVKAGEAFHTTKGEVHNVKNASTTAPAKAVAFYLAKKGTTLDKLSTPVAK
jgi:quercetin dioxygenase-like cupin family protein